MSEPFDLLMKDSWIVDGTGKPAFEGNVGISGETIAALGDIKGDAVREMDGSGL